MKYSWGKWIIAIVAVFLFAAPVLFGFYGDYLWFINLGYQAVFLRIIYYKLALFLLASLISAIILYGGYRWTVHSIRKHDKKFKQNNLIILAIAVVSLLLGILYSSSWDVVLRFIHAMPFNVADPVFGKDISFFTFQLGFYKLAVNFLFIPLLLSIISSLIIYLSKYGFEEFNIEDPISGKRMATQLSFSQFWKNVRTSHLRYPFGLLLILAGIKIYLSRYDLLFSEFGAVFGIGYAETSVILPMLLILSIVTIIAGLLAFIRLNPKVLSGAVVIVVLLAVIGNIGGFLVQNFVVEPDEYNKERQFLQHEIDFTNQAFALDRIDENEFPVTDNLTLADIQDNPETIDNIRLWDWRPLLKTYNELQIFRTYYTFFDVDVDRYNIDGEVKEVMVSAREMDVDALPAQSRSWVNRHLVYTHGFGITMSPVKEVTAEGLPKLIVQDIPPKSSAGIEITQPRIYYGENTKTYAIVNSGTEEFDYPAGDENVYSTYDGEGGVQIDSFLDKLAMAFKFGSSQILFSDSITSDSRIMFHRNIRDRVRTLAPFLEFDEDPYIVVSEGKLYWIYDAYTVTDKYPYSRRMDFKGRDINYIRNSVKIVIDAYSGETNLYVADNDPILKTYRKIFPSLFKEDMPQGLMEHVRYPEDLFKAQSLMYLNYHMKDPKVFYNKEDSWRIPNELLRGANMPMEPYYIIMKLPGNEEAEFIQILPFIPRGKENMIGWMAARSDPPNYGKLQAFLFSKQELIFGPMQIESRIDQDTEISQMITLWSQSGSSVLRGNLLAIPIEDTIMYVEPLFLQSRGEGSLPELKRVIVAQGDHLTMQPTLQEAFDVLFGEATEEPQVQGTPQERDLSDLRRLYREATVALREGDFETYAEKITQLGEELDR